MPERLVLTGDATGISEDGEETVTCTLGGELVELALTDRLEGFFQGEFLRRVERGDQAFAFEPFVGGPGWVTSASEDGGVLISLVGEQPEDAAPYWLAIEIQEAVEVAPFTYEGIWTCAPLGIDETAPPDLSTFGEGTFRLGPDEG